MAHRWELEERSGKGVLKIQPDLQSKAIESEFDLAAFVGTGNASQIAAKLLDPDREQAKALGRTLFDCLLVPGSPARSYWDALSPPAKRGIDLSINTPKLGGIPWELLWDGQNVAIARVGGFFRRVANEQAASKTGWPLKVLVLYATLDLSIGAEIEVRGLKRALRNFGRSIDIRLERGLPDENLLRTILAEYRPDVVHFIGHGGLDINGAYCLKVEHASGTWYWGVDLIQEHFSDANMVPTLVILNCCRSASELGGSQSIQAKFSEIGVPAVIAMQSDVRGDLAAKFSEAFYSWALTDEKGRQESVSEAVRQARLSLGNQPSVDWAIPTLTLCSDVPSTFRLPAAKTMPATPEFMACTEFESTRFFAKCGHGLRQLHDWHLGSQKKLLVLCGPGRSGTSHLLRWCMESWSADGHRVRYMEARAGRNCVNWLVQLRSNDFTSLSDETRLLRAGLDPTPFTKFYLALAKRLGVANGPNLVADVDRMVLSEDQNSTRDIALADGNDLSKIYSLFADGIEKLNNTTVVFDQLRAGNSNPTLFGDLRNHFLARISKSQASVRVVLAILEEDYDRFGLKVLANDAEIVKMPVSYTADELQELSVEALRYPDDEDGVLQKMAALIFGRPPGKLKGLAQLKTIHRQAEDGFFQIPERMR